MKATLKDVTIEFLLNSTPGIGRIFYEKGLNIKSHENEIITANWILKTFGGTITIIKENNEFMVSNPDYLWNSKFWELKNLRTKQALDSGIKKACKQIKVNPGGIIIDTYGFIHKNILHGIIIDRLNRTSINELYIIAKYKDELVNVFEYKKRR